MGLRDWFLPKDRDFYRMLRDQSEKTVEGMRALRDFSNRPTDGAKDLVLRLENEADDLRLHLINELNETFVTPIDREDIHRLSKAVDDILDYAKRTVNEFTIYKVDPTPKAKQIIDVLTTATEEIDRAIHLLERNKAAAAAHAASAKKAENKVEYLFNEALAEIFEGRDTIYILKMREIYRHLSNSADRVDEAADVIHDITVKYS